jgi:CheY-like chemotaxis protein
MHLLWIEDEPGSLRYERRLAEGKGWELELCEHTQGALQLLNATQYDALICDLILPKDKFQYDRLYADTEAGLELIRKIRQPSRAGATPYNVPILVITANPSAVTNLAALQPHEELKVLPKPLDEATYTNALEWLQTRAAGAKAPGKPRHH